jgi:hypothetical protein
MKSHVSTQTGSDSCGTAKALTDRESPIGGKRILITSTKLRKKNLKGVVMRSSASAVERVDISPEIVLNETTFNLL